MWNWIFGKPKSREEMDMEEISYLLRKVDNILSNSSTRVAFSVLAALLTTVLEKTKEELKNDGKYEAFLNNFIEDIKNPIVDEEDSEESVEI